MGDFDKPFPLLQWLSVRLGMSQYRSLGMSQWIYTTPGAARSVALKRSHPTENTAGCEAQLGQQMSRCFLPSNSSPRPVRVRVCACVSVCVILPPVAVRV